MTYTMYVRKRDKGRQGMKRAIYIIILTLSLCLGYQCGMHINHYQNQKATEKRLEEQGFHIYHSFINSGGGSKRTYLKVILIDRDMNLEEMFIKIKDFHEKMNGISSELNISLYESKENLLLDEVLMQKEYYKTEFH